MREIRTAPGFKSDKSKRFDAGLRKTADGMKLGNLRSAREGEAAYGGDIGRQLLWGDDAKKYMGMDIGAIVDKAAVPFEVTKRDGSRERVPQGMRLAANEAGLTSHVLPQAELMISAKEKQMKKNVDANTQ